MFLYIYLFCTDLINFFQTIKMHKKCLKRTLVDYMIDFQDYNFKNNKISCFSFSLALRYKTILSFSIIKQSFMA